MIPLKWAALLVRGKRNLILLMCVIKDSIAFLIVEYLMFHEISVDVQMALLSNYFPSRIMLKCPNARMLSDRNIL